MEEICVGEYVRTREGYIAIIKEVDKKAQVYWFDNTILKISGISCYDLNFQATNYIKKHSPNIIDLIEEGDYVNGSRILDITGDYIYATEWNCCKSRLEKKIKSIVTKEQFNQMKYIVGGE